MAEAAIQAAEATQGAVDTYPHPIGVGATKATMEAENATSMAMKAMAGATETIIGVTTVVGAEMAVVGTKTASSGYAGKPRISHVPGVGAQSCTDARTGPPRHAS